jgi:hypothetical protein
MPTRLYATLLAACLLLAAGACLSRWTSEDLAALVSQGQMKEALVQRLAACCSVQSAKAEAVNDLIAGRLTLRQATERFRELNALMDDGNDELVGPYQVVRDEEPLCRSVLAWAEVQLYQRGDKATEAKVLTRLKEEYRKRFGRDPGPWPPPEAVPTTSPPVPPR